VQVIGKRQHSSRLINVLAVVVLVVGIALCCAGTLVAGFADEFEEVDYPQVLIETEVPIDTSLLPEHPTEKDWYRITAQILEDNGWDLSPNLTMLDGFVPCQSYPALDRLNAHFADAYFVGVIPHLKMASVSLDQTTSTASVLITYQALRWRHDTLDLSRMKVGLREALEIADRYGGQEFRESVSDRCVVSIYVTDYEWKIGYKELGQPTWSDLRIQIDAKSGKAK
jgi:hypothetical protein